MMHGPMNVKNEIQFWFQLVHHNFALLTKSLYISFIHLISDEVEPVAVYV